MVPARSFHLDEHWISSDIAKASEKKHCSPSAPGPPSWAGLETKRLSRVIMYPLATMFQSLPHLNSEGVPLQDCDSAQAMIREAECAEVTSVSFLTQLFPAELLAPGSVWISGRFQKRLFLSLCLSVLCLSLYLSPFLSVSLTLSLRCQLLVIVSEVRHFSLYLGIMCGMCVGHAEEM